MFSYKVDDEIKLALPRLSDVDELYALIDADRDVYHGLITCSQLTMNYLLSKMT